MACELYALLAGATNRFQLPVNPGLNAIYDRPILAGQQPDLTPLTWMELATVDMMFNCYKHYICQCETLRVLASQHSMQA
jgi:hypothetical protein